MKGRRIAGRAIVVTALAWSCGHDVAARQGAEPRITMTAAERFAGDLALSEAQRAILVEGVEAYRAWFPQAEAETIEALKIEQRELYLRLKPELDESYDISDLPPEEQRQIIRDRDMFRRLGRPFHLTGEQVNDLNDLSQKHWNVFRAHDLEQREALLDAMREVLAPEQLERWPAAMRRLEINIADQKRDDRPPRDDPESRPDMLGLLVEATEEGAELYPLADAVRAPDIVLAVEPAESDRARVAAVVQAFEVTYLEAMQASRRIYDDVHEEQVRLFNSGVLDEAAKLERRMQDGRRRVWDVRQRFVFDLASLVYEIVGDPAREAWERRCRARFCPVLYLPESTDMLFRKVIAIEGLSPQVITIAEQVYRQHCDWREVHRVRVVNLEIEERWSTLMTDRAASVANGDDENIGLRARLIEAHEARRERAAQVNRHLRALLPPEHQAAFDEWLESWRKENPDESNPLVIRIRP